MENNTTNLPESQPRLSRKYAWLLALFVLLVVSVLFPRLLKSTGKPHTLPDKFDLAQGSPADQDNSYSPVGEPVFVFTKPIGILESDLSKYFSINPKVEGAWHLEKNRQVVYFSSGKKESDKLPNTFDFNTVYTITINKSLHDAEGKGLAKDVQVSFRTKQSPLFGIESNDKLISSSPNKPVSIELTMNQSDNPIVGPFTVVVKPASEDQLLQYFSYKENKFPLYEFTADSTEKGHEYRANIEKNEFNQYVLRLDGSAFPEPGIYYVNFKNSYGSDDLFVSVSNHIDQVFDDSDSTYIWSSDSNTGRGINGVTSKFYQVNGAPVLLEKDVSGGDGIAKVGKPANRVDFVVTTSGKDTAVTFSKSYGYFGYSSTKDDKYSVFSFSDRPVYRPGDTVHYKAVLRKKDNGKYIIASGTYYAKLLFDYYSPDPNSAYKPLQVDADGTVTFDQLLPQMASGAYPQITLSVKKSDGTYTQIDSLPIVIQSYRKPDMDITATAQEKEYISSDTAHYKIYAKTNFGQPLTNVSFSYRVLVSDYEEVKDRTTENVGESVSGYYGTGDQLASGTGKFNDKGVAQISFTTKLPGKYERSQIATLEITPNVGAAPSIGKIAKLIHRGEFAMFFDNVAGDTTNGISGRISVFNHSIPRAHLSNKELKVSLYKVVNYNDKQLLDNKTVTTGDDGMASISFDKKDAGNYELVAQSDDSRGNTVTARQQMYVGQQYQSSANQQQDYLTLSTEKNSYKVNETANVVLSSNFNVGDAIVVLTNEGSSFSNIISLSKSAVGGSSWNLPITMKDEYGQALGVDIYTVNNGMVRGGHVNLAIDKGEHKINTSITFDKQIYKPGDTVLATLTTKDQNGNPVSADNSLSVIDESLLQIGQLNGDILTSFYGYTPYSYVTHFDSTMGIKRNFGGGGGGCFLEGTQVLMSDGSSKNIEDVHVGDKILTRASDGSSVMVEDTVTNTYRHEVSDYISINDRLNVTWVHRIFLNHDWHEAKDARVGDTLLDENGNEVSITSITPHLGQFAVYNLTTSHYHTFFASGFYVHNDKGQGPRENFADTAYWNPHIQTDSHGQAKVSFKLPDNVTTFTAQTFSNTKDSQFGQVTANFVSQKNFNIIPAIANFYYDGDRPIISSLVQNSSQQNVDVQVSLTVKELSMSKKQSLHIDKGDFGVAAFPLDIRSNPGNLTFLIEVKDPSGNTLDSLQMKKPILPKGNINGSWMSFTGSRDVTLTATYPSLDFNTVDLSVVPNFVSNLANNGVYFVYEPSVEAGKDLYAYSYILAMTRDGHISPTLYNYALLRSQFRETVSSLLQKRTNDHWNPPPYGLSDSITGINLWLAQGLEQAKKYHTLDDISDISTIASRAKNYVKNISPLPNIPMPSQSPAYASPNDVVEDPVARQWILSSLPANNPYKDSLESLAIRALTGDSAALGKLKSMNIITADDRYIWDGNSGYAQVLPALAMVEKGSLSDADKAIKGLSVSFNGIYSPDPLALYAGVEYAVRKGLYIDKPIIKVSVDGQLVYDNSQKTANNGSSAVFHKSLAFKNDTDGKLLIHIDSSGDIPVYSTIVQMDYNQKLRTAGDSFAQWNILQNLLGWKSQDAKGKNININLNRMYKDIQSGKKVQSINEGEAGIVALTGTKNFMKNSGRNSYKDSFMLEDAISPSFLFLNQTSDFSNNPQYQSVLKRVFAGSDQIYGSSNPPTDYSDEAVFFNSAPNQPLTNFVFPYVVYNVVGGTYYQPKTSIVFPILGLIANEE